MAFVFRNQVRSKNLAPMMQFHLYRTRSSELKSRIHFLKTHSDLTKLYNFSHHGIISASKHRHRPTNAHTPQPTSPSLKIFLQQLLCARSWARLLYGCRCLTVNSPAAFIGNYCWRSHISSEPKFQEKKQLLCNCRLNVGRYPNPAVHSNAKK